MREKYGETEGDRRRERETERKQDRPCRAVCTMLESGLDPEDNKQPFKVLFAVAVVAFNQGIIRSTILDLPPLYHDRVELDVLCVETHALFPNQDIFKGEREHFLNYPMTTGNNLGFP